MTQQRKAFFVRIGDDTALYADPAEPLVTGCAVVLRLGDSWLPGRLVTKYPNKAKTLRVQVDSRCRPLHGCDRADVVRVTRVHRSV
jgi:hypothetical protein